MTLSRPDPSLRRQGQPCRLIFSVPSMTDSMEVEILYPARWRRRISEAQGRHWKVSPEGSVEQSCDPMNKNRIRGLPGRTSSLMTAKSTAFKGWDIPLKRPVRPFFLFPGPLSSLIFPRPVDRQRFPDSGSFRAPIPSRIPFPSSSLPCIQASCAAAPLEARRRSP